MGVPPILSAPDAPGPAPAYRLSGWWRRAGGSVLDFLVLLIPFVVLALIFGGYRVAHTSNGNINSTSVNFNLRWYDYLLWFAYAAVLLVRMGARNGATIGKQAAGISVVRDDGQPVDLRTAAVREGLIKGLPAAVGALLGGPVLAAAALFLLVNYLWPLWEPENRALHDLAAGTHVVWRSKPPATFAPYPR